MADQESTEPTPQITEAQGGQPPVAESPVVRMQHVIITLADGRRGVFMGPELIKEVEMKLNVVPKLVSVDFDPPRAVSIPVPRETVPVADPVEETPNADTKVDATPAAGLE